jgi:SAM-dependent methyltransferase
MSEYETIFQQRGGMYDLAMKNFPNARRLEFLRLFDHIDLKKVKYILDIPAGGGYVLPFLPSTCELVSYEACDGFNPPNLHGKSGDLESIQLTENSFDLVICLAAIHHVNNKEAFLTACSRSLKVDGVLCIADVPAESGIASFLDNFTGKYNGTGHHGKYLKPESVEEVAKHLGLELISNEVKNCEWEFSNTEELCEFCELLFGLKGISRDALLAALEKHIGIKEIEGRVLLNWHLLYVTMKK